MTTPNNTWRRKRISGDLTLHTWLDWTIESSSGRTRNGDRTGYRAGSVALLRGGRYVRTCMSVADAKRAAERREDAQS